MMQKISKSKTIKIFLFAFLLFASGTTNAQVGIGTPTPNASAQLDVSSTSKGFLPPRMTQAQRNSITKPAAGLTVWCKDCGVLGEIQVYNGFGWTNMTGGNASTPLPLEVTIGSQVWMTKDLDVVTYRNGDTIPQGDIFGTGFGKAYSWYAVNDPRGLAPAGWHVASYPEWFTLIDYLGGSIEAAYKIQATILWQPPTYGHIATNESGFTALPNSLYESEFGTKATWWTTSISTDPYRAVAIDLNADSPRGASLSFFRSYFDFFYSVRCVKD